MTLIFIIFVLLLSVILLKTVNPFVPGKPLERIFPIWKIEDHVVISKSGDLTVIFKLELPEVFTLSEKEFDALHREWIKALRVLPAGAILHKQDWFTRESYQSDFSGDKGFLE